uniref:Methyltranfer_dom domain-containing protein n=1 Tax=Schistocephalus solidus TaxID=70667 RepID=A0A183T3R6_SCHSO
LGTYLSLAHGIPVLEIDSREFWNLQSKKQAAGKEVVFQSDCASITCSVTSALQLDSLLAQAARLPAPRCLLTGLHTCGGLSVTLLRTFVQSARAAALVNAPCCYHLLQEAGGSAGAFVERLDLSRSMYFSHLFLMIHCHYMMRCCFGPVVEACILLDRVLFLFEAVTPRLVRVFDPLISPRCHAIVATK